MEREKKLIREVEDATVRLRVVPALINLLVEQYHLDKRETDEADLMYFKAAKEDLLRLLYLASNLVQDANEAMEAAITEAMDNMREEG